MNRRRLFGKLAIIAVAAGLVGSAVTPGASAASHRAAVRPHVEWCLSYDTLPMTDMSEQQMMDEMTFYPDMKHRLAPGPCSRLVRDLVAARRYALQFPTAAEAIAGGFHQVAVSAPGQGAHYMGPQGFGPTFDPKVPNFLLYGGNSPTAPLVGLMWLVNSGQQPPAFGLPGNNDHWHRHGMVCWVGPMIVAENLTNEQCASIGGANIDISNLWMLHVWIVAGFEYPPDIFRPHVPFL